MRNQNRTLLAAAVIGLAICAGTAQASPRSVALAISQAAGEPNPSIEAVGATTTRMHGHFTLNAPIPRGQSAPSGDTLDVESASGQVVALRLVHSQHASTSRRRVRAHAAWGSSCSQVNHCYAIAEQEGSVVGTLAYQYVTAMNVPGWNIGDFVTDEEWAAWWDGRWIEVGLMGGGASFTPADCCSLFPFAAYQNSRVFYIYRAPWAYPGWTNVLLQLSGQSRNGTWCPYFEQTQVFCVGGFGGVYAPILQVGAETGANYRPSNAGHEGTNAWWPNGSVTNWRNEHVFADGGMCLGRWPYPYPALGNIYYGTC